MPVATETPPSSAASSAPVRRPRKTSRAVRFIDRLTSTIITGGGIMVIVAVLGIMVYLVTVVVPLFRGATISQPIQYPLFPKDQPRDLLFTEINEYKTLGMALDRAGKLVLFDARTGKTSEEQSLLPEDARVTAFARGLRDGHVAFGFADGTVRLGEIRFTADGMKAKLEDAVAVGKPGVPVSLIDYKVSGNREVFTVLKEDGELHIDEVTRKENIVTGKVQLKLNKHTLPFTPTDTPPAFLLQNAQGDQIFIAWRDGMVRRYDLRRIDQPVVAEIKDVVTGEGTELTDFRFIFGDQSLIVADSRGRLAVWFRVERPQAGTVDGYELVPAHTLMPQSDSILITAVSSRDKGLLSATAKGEIVLRHMTSEQILGRVQLPGQTGIESLQMTPKADGIFAVDAHGVAWLWDIDNPHPETTWKTIFGKVWYEGYPKPEYTWQSSSGNDDFEPKFSLIPLIFGTLKATVYSLFFAIPIALLGAIYTSEFLDKRIRPALKSTIETMASLPSVVLGFVAALILAPIVENWIMAVLAAFALVPLAVITMGYLWQMLPQPVIVRFAGWPQFLMVLAVVILTVLGARACGGVIENMVFHGDFKAWLDGRVGTGAPGITVMLWPWMLLAVWFLQRKLIADRINLHFAGRTRWQVGLVELAKMLSIVIVTTLLAALVAKIATAMGFDPRGAMLGTYVQRNTLVVGFVMGFAVIPIIYTISEDALSSVPEHLRSASLGCGATRWQTAIRVITPVAMSGIFSAIMIGLGRAVGETMIVVMAAGNTPVMDANIFNGLRALSANIAVELPEAVKDSTLFRMLFLAALTLFVMTFVINTLAEIIRMRFRKRAYQL